MTEMGKYDRLTDEQLIERLRAGEREIMDHLIVKYKSMVRKKRGQCTCWAERMRI